MAVTTQQKNQVLNDIQAKRRAGDLSVTGAGAKAMVNAGGISQYNANQQAKTPATANQNNAPGTPSHPTAPYPASDTSNPQNTTVQDLTNAMNSGGTTAFDNKMQAKKEGEALINQTPFQKNWYQSMDKYGINVNDPTYRELQQQVASGQIYDDQGIQNYITNQKLKQGKSQVDFSQNQMTQQNAIDAANLRNTQNQALGSQAGIQNSLLGGAGMGREGFMSSGNTMASQQISSDIQAQVDQAGKQLQMIYDSRANAQKNLKEAQDNNNLAAVADYSKQLKQLDIDEQKVKNDAADTALKAKTLESTIAYQQAVVKNQATQNFNSFFKELPAGSLANTTPEQQMAIAQQYGISTTQVSAYAQIDKQKAALQLTDPDYLYKKAQIDYMTKQTQELGKTPEQKNIELYQNLLKTDPTTADGLGLKLGISPEAMRQARIESDLKEAQAQEIRSKISETYRVSGGDNPNVTRIGDGEVYFNVDPDGTVYGQCGELFNNKLGDFYNAHVGNSYASKKAIANSDVPVAGGAFIMNTGSTYGHIGLITKTYADGSFDIIDSNRNNDQKIKTGHFTADEAKGLLYFDPNKTKKVTQQGEQSYGTPALSSVPKEYRQSVITKASEFDTQQPVKSFQILQESKNLVDSLASNTTNPVDDQALIYAFAKAMDPNSVVRESEYATAQAYAQDTLSKLGYDVQRFFDAKGFLKPDARGNIKTTINSKYKASEKSYDQTRNSYIKTINNLAGADVGSKVLQDYKFDTTENKPTPKVQTRTIEYQGKRYSVDEKGDMTEIK